MRVGELHVPLEPINEVWRIVKDEFDEPIEVVKADDYLCNGTYYSTLLDGFLDVSEVGWIITEDRMKLFDFVGTMAQCDVFFFVPQVSSFNNFSFKYSVTLLVNYYVMTYKM